MSAPPPYLPNDNPDRRPLPPGWVTQYDNNYRTWFYVNAGVNPPVTTWTHPLGAPPVSPPRSPNYGAPAGPPPSGPSGPGYGYNNSPQGQYQGYGGYQQSPPQPYYGGSPSPPQGYGSGPNYGNPGYGGYREEENRGFFGRPSSNAPQQYAPAPPPKKSGPGMGTMIGVGAAGLLGGAVIGEMIEHHEDEERFDAYQDGVQQGQMDDYNGGGGDGFGGGDDYGGGGDW